MLSGDPDAIISLLGLFTVRADEHLARLRGFEPSAAGAVFAFVRELRYGQALAARIRFAVASRVVAAQGLKSSTCGESAKTG